MSPIGSIARRSAERLDYLFLSAIALLHDDRAQNAFEYLLALAGFVMVIIAAFWGFDVVVAEVLGNVCPSVDTYPSPPATPVPIGGCITP